MRKSLRSILLVSAVAGSLVATAPVRANDPPTFVGGPTHFATMSDGTSIALNVVMPYNYNPALTYPALLEMAGYENGSSSSTGRTMLGELDDYFTRHGAPPGKPPLANDSHEGTSAFRYDNEYVSVHASVRGTGCSSGEFDLFSSRSALDGYEVIENWIVDQTWSNDKVGILGHSYSGMTGFMVAATQPPHLTAITVSGLIDDLYRAITFPGGVSNAGFPVLWTLGVRPAYDVLGGSVQGMARHGADPIGQQCAKNISSRRRTVLNDPIVQGTNDTDNDWWRSRSLITYAHLINRPIHITGAWQDEQTGPRGFTHLWEEVDGTSKRLLVTNGDHGVQVASDETWPDRKAWMDYWMLGPPKVDSGTTSVRTLFELRNNLVSQYQKDSTSFPLEDTVWTPFSFGTGADSYLSGSGRQSWSYQAGTTSGSQFTTPQGPDELTYTMPAFTTNTAVVGPMMANLFISSTAPDTELMVEVLDIAPNGARTYLQRGLLRASHRAIDRGHSDFFGTDPVDGGPFLYRPFRPHTNPIDILPGAVVEYEVEIFPVGHIFRLGHSLSVKIHAPSRVDSYYAYVQKTPPAVNTLHSSSAFPSRIVLPIVAAPAGITPANELACGAQHSVRCIS